MNLDSIDRTRTLEIVTNLILFKSQRWYDISTKTLSKNRNELWI